MSAIPRPPRSADRAAYGPAIDAALKVLRRDQREDGSWKGDYSSVMFLPPMYVGTMHVLGEPVAEADREGLIRYLRAGQNPDGGFGLGLDNPSTVFTTVLVYVAWRLLGVPADDPDAVRARDWFLARGGPTRAASWGRFFLAVLGLYDWSGVDPTPPETWILPRSLPVFPGRMWCHARMVYLPMAWLYGRRATGPITPTIEALRRELYPEGYDRVAWRRARGRVAPEDANTPRTGWHRLVFTALGAYERVAPQALRQRALDACLGQIRYEDEITNHRCIGPVNKLYDTLVWHFVDPGGEQVQRHLEVLPIYLQRDARGVRMNGYDSSQLWDTAFGAQAVLAAAPTDGADVLEHAHRYVDAAQVREDPPDRLRYHRCRSEGAWPFSTRDHGWPITDCTAEGLVVALELADRVSRPLPLDRLRPAAERLLEWQNPDGGWASYERTRGPAWLETINPSDVFTDIMVDHSHTECSAASMKGLARFKADHPGVLDDAIEGALARGAVFLRHQQRPDGGWYGGWAVCFTYGTWFGITGLRAAGMPPTDSAIRRAVSFLESIRLPDGGWGEHVEACRRREPVPTPTSQPVQTAWAVLALLAAGERDSFALRAGVRWLLAHQEPDGTWDQGFETGVFNGTCSIHYHAYPKVFPLWALGQARRQGVIPAS